jgi:hypothetical protein
MGQYYQSGQVWPASKTKETMPAMANMANPWAGALSQEYNT